MSKAPRMLLSQLIANIKGAVEDGDTQWQGPLEMFEEKLAKDGDCFVRFTDMSIHADLSGTLEIKIEKGGK